MDDFDLSKMFLDLGARMLRKWWTYNFSKGLYEVLIAKVIFNMRYICLLILYKKKCACVKSNMCNNINSNGEFF